jgi:hypothetical protein
MCARRIPSLEEPILDAGVVGRRQQSREPVEPRDNTVRDYSWLDVVRPADHRRRSECPFPVGVLLAAEGRHGPVRPRVHVRAVIGRVNDNRVVGDAEIVEGLEQRADIVVVLEHSIELFADAAAAPH